MQQLSSILLPKPPDPKTEIDFIMEQQHDLALEEHWEHHIAEIQFPDWVRYEPRPILWIGGRPNKRGVSWVSSFSMDIVEALETERRVDINLPIVQWGTKCRATDTTADL